MLQFFDKNCIIVILVCLGLLMTTVFSQLAQASSNTKQQHVNTLTISENEQFPTFDEFIKLYNKVYEKDSEEYNRRKQIYDERVKKLRQMKSDPSVTYTVGVSQFSDQTQQQRLKRKPLLVDSQQKKTSKQEIHKLSQAAGGTPLSLDWRQSGIVTSIKDQGNCGACWTFATAAYGQSRLVKNGTKNIDINLSQQFLLSCTPQCSCEGGYLQYVFQKAADGVPQQNQYPYNPYSFHSPFICWAGSKIFFGYYPKKYYDIGDDQLKGLLKEGPVAISISANNWQQYKGGVFSCQTYDKVNHAVLLVGYTPSYWIVKNQWGTKWGQQGFIRVTRDPRYNCKIGTSAFIMWENHQTFIMLFILIITLCFL